MKKNWIFITAIMLGFSVSAMAQQGESKNYIFTYNCGENCHTVGMYGGLYGSYSEVFGKSAGYLGGRLGLVFDQNWGIGIGGYGLGYDRHLSELVDDGTYRLEAAYGGMYVEYIQPINDWFKISASIFTGQGLTHYVYDKEYAEDRPWYQEAIDRETFAVFEPGIELQLRLSSRWWIGAHASYRTTSPIKLEGTNPGFLENANAGIMLKYGLY